MFEKATPIKYSFVKKAEIWFLRNPVFIFSVGKVGSSTIANTLRKYGIYEVQPHSLRYSRIGSYFVIPKNTHQLFIRNFYKTLLIRIKGFFLKLKIRFVHRRVKVVTLVRDPISRNISAFFEQFPHISNRPMSEYNTNELIELFWESCNHDAPLVWFDKEMKPFFGVDVLEYGFDKEHGFAQYSVGKIDVLVLKMEKVSTLSSVMSNYFEVPDFEIVATNRADNKEYAEAYKDFKSNLKISKDYADKFYTSELIRHFYTREEIEGFYRKWVND